MASSPDQRRAAKSSVVAAVVLAILLVILVLGYQRMQAWSYQKLAPYAVTISYTAESAASLNIQYDYGYGYLPEHQQVVELASTDEVQQIAISISAWKMLDKLRLWSTQADEVKIHSFDLQQGGKLLAATASPGQSSDTNVIVEYLVGPSHSQL